MSSTAPTIRKKTKRSSTDSTGSGWKTVLLNCDCHTFESVIAQLIYAIGCSYEAARRLAYVVHSTGQATVFTGTQETCDTVADKLAEIGLKVRVSQ